jgi:hypothetical protein
MKTKLSLLLVLSMISFFSFGKKVEIQLAQSIAKNVFFEKAAAFNSLKYTDINISEAFTISEANEAVYYIFNFNNSGFVILSADDDVSPVLAYSYENIFKMENQPQSIAAWMDGYKKQIINVKANGIKANNNIKAEWDYYSNSINFSTSTKATYTIGTYLCRSNWDQTQYYNEMCPEDAAGVAGHVVVGCVATCMAQVMYYWRWPLTGSGSHGYTANTYGYLSANFGTTTYNYNEMVDVAIHPTPEIAKISYHCGIAVDMDYAPDGSAAHMADAVYALKTYFKYQTSVSEKSRWSYSESSWINLLKTEINALRPVLYSGSSQASGGHAFVCDGFDATNKFHFNWGWSSYGNGFYAVALLNPVGEDFSQGQSAIINIQPIASSYPTNCTGTKTVTTTEGSIEDGSGPVANYTSNADCSWLIWPNDSISKITLTFNDFALSTGDEVKVYNGPNESSPLLGTFTGTTLPAAVSTTQGKMFVKFTSDGSGNEKGWSAKYSTTVAKFCANTTTLTAASGAFVDGSENYNYHRNSLCRWNINPPTATSIIIHFDSFRVATGDYVKITDFANGTVFAAGLVGTTVPADIVCASNNVLVMFKTLSTSPTEEGWSLTYSTTSGVNEASTGIDNLIVYPNPTSDYLNISFNTVKNQDMRIDLVTLTGQVVYTENVHYNMDVFNGTVNITALPKGVYFLKISSDLGLASKKIVIQ